MYAPVIKGFSCSNICTIYNNKKWYKKTLIYICYCSTITSFIHMKTHAVTQRNFSKSLYHVCIDYIFLWHKTDASGLIYCMLLMLCTWNSLAWQMHGIATQFTCINTCIIMVYFVLVYPEAITHKMCQFQWSKSTRQ